MNKKLIIKALRFFAVSVIILSLPLFVSCANGTDDRGAAPLEKPSEGETLIRPGIVECESVSFEPVYMRLTTGNTYKLNVTQHPDGAAEQLRFYSSDSGFTINGDELTVREAGTTMITAETFDGSRVGSVMVMGIQPPDNIINADYISQLGRYPNGCEAISAVMALNYAGLAVEPDEFIDGYLPMTSLPGVDENGLFSSNSPWKYYLGDPRRSDGLFCYDDAIIAACEELCGGSGGYEIFDLGGNSLEWLCANYIQFDIPVIVWATVGMQPPQATENAWVIRETGKYFDWFPMLHCVLLTGYDDEYYYFNDPLVGKAVAYDKSMCERAYNALGSQAVAIRSASV